MNNQFSNLVYEDNNIMQTSDITLPAAMNYLLIGLWIGLSLFGIAVIKLMDLPVIGAVIIGIPSFVIMVLKPTFALSVFMLVLPTGAGFSYGGMFTLTKGVGWALGFSFLLNIMVSRPRLKVNHKTLWLAICFMVWLFISTLSFLYLKNEMVRVLSSLQLLALLFITYWIIETNTQKTLIWALRAYVLGAVGTNLLAILTGAALRSVEMTSQGRYTATLGEMIDANFLASLTALSFLSAIYLFVRDKSHFWKIFYFGALILLPLILLRIGSRSAFLGLGGAFLVALTLRKRIWGKNKLIPIVVISMAIAAILGFSYIQILGLQEDVAERLTSLEAFETSLAGRISYIKAALEAAAKYPLGAGYFGWFERTGIDHWPHTDFIFILGIYGVPGLVIFSFMILFTIIAIIRMARGPEKFFSVLAITYLLVAGQGNPSAFKKFYWLFLGIILACERISWIYKQSEEIIELTPEEAEAYLQSGDSQYLILN